MPSVSRLLYVTALMWLTSVSFSHPLDDLAPGHWYEVPNSRLEQVNPCPDVACPPGNTGLKSVMIAWSGGTLDTTRHRLLVWGGGHADYSGNELYAFNIDTMTWERLTDPSPTSGGSTWLYGDGRPRSMHTHTYIEYVPDLDKFVSFGGVAPYPVSGTTRSVFAYDFARSSWETSSIPAVPSGGTARGANAVYDPATGDVWVISANTADSRLHRYDTSANSWSSYAKQFVDLYTVAAIDPGRRLLVTVGNGQILAWDLRNPEAAPFVPSTSGDRALESRGAPGFVFDSNVRKFVGWGSGSRVYVLDPDTWVWERREADNGNAVVPTNAPSAGTYGRFQYLPHWNAYVLVNSVSENVYFYRLAGTFSRPLPPEDVHIE